MSQVNKKRNAPIPHRAINKVSPWRMPLEKITESKDGFVGFRNIMSVTGEDGLSKTDIKVSSNYVIGPEHGRLVYFLASIASKRNGYKATISLNDILDETGVSKRTRTRNRLLELIKQAETVKIGIGHNGGKINTFSLISKTSYDAASGEITVHLDDEYVESLRLYKERYIEVGDVMKLNEKQSLAIELANYLKIRGGGVGKDGSKAAKKIYHYDAVLYLCLFNHNEKTQKVLLRRAFNELEKIGYPKYEFVCIDGTYFWTYSKGSKPAKRFLPGGDDLHG